MSFLADIEADLENQVAAAQATVAAAQTAVAGAQETLSRLQALRATNIDQVDPYRQGCAWAKVLARQSRVLRARFCFAQVVLDLATLSLDNQKSFEVGLR
jgi:hypothetical protein